MFKTDLNGLYNNLIASAVWFIIGLAVAAIINYFRRRRFLRIVWGISKHSTDLSVAISTLTPQDTGEYFRPTTGMGALLATANVSQSLADAYPRNRPHLHMYFSANFPSNLLQYPIISIGGPKTNTISKRILADEGLRYNFIISKDAYVSDKETGAEFRSKTDDKTILKDYAIITRSRNPYNSSQFAMTLAGVHTFGVAAAAAMLTSAHARELESKVRKLGDYWQALVEVDLVGEEVFPKIINVCRIPI